MDTKVIIAVVVGVIVGAGGALAFGGDGDKASRTASTVAPSHMQQSNDSMMAELDDKTGEEFDRAFMTQMIVHHEGAIQMAELALQNAQRDEIKKLAQDIISAQKTEIQQMQGWQASWYGTQAPVTSGDGVMPGSAVHNMP